jgi:predicted RNA-binding protein YlqC (UPF0109 family)
MAGLMKELVEDIVRALVDHPENVVVSVSEGSKCTTLEVTVHPSDLGKVIGREGRMVNAIRSLLGSIGMKQDKRYLLHILEN